FSNSIDDNKKQFNEKLHKIQQNYINITCQFLHDHFDFSIGRRMFEKLVPLLIDIQALYSTLGNANSCEMVEDKDRPGSSQTTYNPNQQSAEPLPISASPEFNSTMISDTSHLNELQKENREPPLTNSPSLSLNIRSSSCVLSNTTSTLENYQK
ncbi:unnamed protein product, partial [Rotaria sp. Silwood2]